MTTNNGAPTEPGLRPVMQTRFGNDRDNPDDRASWGNCLSACVATILGLDIDDVPTFFGAEIKDGEGMVVGQGSWFLEFEGWLRGRGLGTIVQYPEDGVGWYITPGVHGIATGKSPRGEWNHSVVIDSDGNIAHDPNPDGRGLDGGAKEVVFFVPFFGAKP